MLWDHRKSQVGTGARSEKIRAYNYKDNRMTDHRLKMNFELTSFLDGDVETAIQVHAFFPLKVEHILSFFSRLCRLTRRACGVCWCNSWLVTCINSPNVLNERGRFTCFFFRLDTTGKPPWSSQYIAKFFSKNCSFFVQVLRCIQTRCKCNWNRKM